MFVLCVCMRVHVPVCMCICVCPCTQIKSMWSVLHRERRRAPAEGCDCLHLLHPLCHKSSVAPAPWMWGVDRALLLCYPIPEPSPAEPPQGTFCSPVKGPPWVIWQFAFGLMESTGPRVLVIIVKSHDQCIGWGWRVQTHVAVTKMCKTPGKFLAVSRGIHE